MYLSQGKIGKMYKIKNIFLERKIKNRLWVLGMTKETNVKILNKNFNGALILKVRGTRFAICKDISNSIIIN